MPKTPNGRRRLAAVISNAVNVIPKGRCVMLKARLLGAVGIVAVVGGGIAGMRASQAPVTQAFEVTSIKHHAENPSVRISKLPPGPPARTARFQSSGRFTAENASLRLLIETAYPGLPIGGVVANDTFDINATAQGDPPLDQMEQMLRTLLTERFALQTHEVTRQLRAYKLVMASKNKTLGPKLRASLGPCVNTRPGTPPDPSGLPRCADRFGSDLKSRGIAMADVTMDQLAAALGRVLKTGVSNQTALAGTFDVDIVFTSTTIITENFCEGILQGAGVACPPATSPAAEGPARAAGPSGAHTLTASVFDVLPKQLGLKLESTTGPVDVLVIDHVEHPTEN